jgi:hypothetical protein
MQIQIVAFGEDAARMLDTCIPAMFPGLYIALETITVVVRSKEFTVFDWDREFQSHSGYACCPL